MEHPITVETIPDEAHIHINVVGVQNTGAGRQVQPVNKSFVMKPFLAKYSTLTQASKPDMKHVKALTKDGDFGGASAYLAEFQAQANKVGSATLTDIIVDAVSKYLVNEEGLVESEVDPGAKFYFQRSDLSPQWINGGKSGTMFCMVALTAPFGCCS